MRHRTLVKTLRIPAAPPAVYGQGSFGQYAAMVERLAAGYFRPLSRRQPRRPW